MIRRIALLVGTLALLVGAFAVYHYWVVGDREIRRTRPGTPATAPELSGQAEGRELYTEVRDPTGRRLEGVYKARTWDKIGEERYRLTEPEIELYQSKGRRVFIRGDEGLIEAEEVASGVNPRQGRLRGNVEIVIDRGNAVVDGPMDQRPEDLIRIYMNDVRFDNDALMIETEDRITLFSAEADLVGKGMTIRWNDEPRELRLLRIDAGEYMAVYEVPGGLGAMSLPGGRTDETPAAGGEGDAPATRPSASAPETAPAPATRPTPAPGDQRGRNVYLATFEDGVNGVNVDYGENRIHGAAELSLTFQWDEESEDLMEPGRRSTPSTAPAAQTGTRPTTRRASTRPAAPTEARPEPMIITWRGPLTLTPVAYTPTPSQDEFTLEGRGERVTLSDARATATCREFRFRHPEQTGRLVGTDADPARLEMDDGRVVVCPTFTFDRPERTATLVGAGRMIDPTGGSIGGDQPATTAPASDEISWSQRVIARFGVVAAPDGRTREVLRSARFLGNVRAGRSGSEDFIHSDELKVWMSEPDEAGESDLTRALATGNVSARQRGMSIRADRQVELTFAPAPEGAEDDAPAPAELTAEGNVQVTDDRGESPLTAECDRLVSDLVAREATLTGDPAVVTQGPNRMSGPRIVLSEEGEVVRVDGAGALAFVTRRGINGRDLEEPRDVDVRWDREMTYRGAENTAVFTGGVALDSLTEHLTCEAMTLWFEQAPATETAPAGASDAMGFEMERFNRRRISSIRTRGDVQLSSVREDGRGAMQRRLKLWGDDVTFTPAREEVRCKGPGRFLAEDYRPPEPDAADGSDDPMSGNISRPSQSAFEWNRSMVLRQDERRVELTGDVGMVHRSGAKVDVPEGLKVPTWPELPAGRLTVLRCDEMAVTFAAPEDAGSEPADDDLIAGGPRIGPLERFSAGGGVNLKDGPRQAIGERLIYDRGPDMVVIWGYAEGGPRAAAEVYYEDPQTGRVQKQASPKIIWDRGDNRIMTEEAVGTGTR